MPRNATWETLPQIQTRHSPRSPDTDERSLHLCSCFIRYPKICAQTEGRTKAVKLRAWPQARGWSQCSGALLEFQGRFATDSACAEYLFERPLARHSDEDIETLVATLSDVWAANPARLTYAPVEIAWRLERRALPSARCVTNRYKENTKFYQIRLFRVSLGWHPHRKHKI